MPWRIYLITYSILSAIIFGVIYVLITRVKVKLLILIILSVFLVVANTFVFGMITYYGFKEEEIRDAKKLADLYKKIKQERIL